MWSQAGWAPRARRRATRPLTAGLLIWALAIGMVVLPAGPPASAAAAAVVPPGFLDAVAIGGLARCTATTPSPAARPRAGETAARPRTARPTTAA